MPSTPYQLLHSAMSVSRLFIGLPPSRVETYPMTTMPTAFRLSIAEAYAPFLESPDPLAAFTIATTGTPGYACFAWISCSHSGPNWPYRGTISPVGESALACAVAVLDWMTEGRRSRKMRTRAIVDKFTIDRFVLEAVKSQGVLQEAYAKVQWDMKPVACYATQIPYILPARVPVSHPDLPAGRGRPKRRASRARTSLPRSSRPRRAARRQPPGL